MCAWREHRGVALLAVACLATSTAAGDVIVARPAPADDEASNAAPDGGKPAATADAPARALPNLRLDRDGFLGGSDRHLLDRLIQGQVVRVKKGSGGRSLGFKLYFENGDKAYFKPAQTFSGTIWFAEIAAFHLDRLLGMRRVPPVTSYRMPWKQLAGIARGDRRRKEVLPNEDGSVDGALVYWLPEQLAPCETPPGWENWLRVEPFARWQITPYQRPAAYTANLAQRRTRLKAGERAESFYDEVPAPDDPALAAALSDMLVLDFLTLNIDRWGGNNGNVLCYGDQDPTLIFLDNAAGFSDGPHRRGLMDDRLEVQQRFRRETIAALRAFDRSALSRRLAGEAITPILSEHLLSGVEVRVDALLSHVDALIAEHGEDEVLGLP